MKQVLSYGGGVDSFALLLDALERGAPPDLVAFADVADGSPTRDPIDPGEWPGTYRHIREIVIPLCARAGIEFEWIDTARYPVRDARSLFAWMTDRFPQQDVEVWIGFEAGEERRVKKDPNAGTKPSKQRRDPNAARRHNRFPLIERRLCRCRCVELVRRLGFPVPRKSACAGCCYGSMSDWQTLARELPAVFDKFVQLEARKPPTAAGHKLSIMGYRTIRNAAGDIVEVQAPPLTEWIRRKARGPRGSCKVCGAVARATKATGCGYLDEVAAPQRQLQLLGQEAAA